MQWVRGTREHPSLLASQAPQTPLCAPPQTGECSLPLPPWDEQKRNQPGLTHQWHSKGQRAPGVVALQAIPPDIEGMGGLSWLL